MKKFSGVRKTNCPHHDNSFSFSFPWSPSKWSILGKIDWPKSLESVAKDLIRKLLVIDRTKRIGNLKNGADDIKNHKWFKGEEKLMTKLGKLFDLLFFRHWLGRCLQQKIETSLCAKSFIRWWHFKFSGKTIILNEMLNDKSWYFLLLLLFYFRNILMRSWRLTPSLRGRRESSRNSRWKILASPMAHPTK